MIELPPPGADATAWPPLAVSGRIRVADADFFVAEELGFQPDGAGQHQLLLIRKTGANTRWVARCLARVAGIREGDVGYCGLKDRRAVTEQWFSVPAAAVSSVQAAAAADTGFELLRTVAHGRKLRRGSHAGNRFRVVIRHLQGATTEIEARLAAIARDGVPNYFGPQRFGRQQGNLRLAATLAAGGRLRRAERGFALSAARSLLFNQVLAHRVEERTWDRLVPGDVAALDGSRSIFRVDDVDAVLEARLRDHDIHPSGPLWGSGAVPSGGSVRELELEIRGAWAAFAEMLENCGSKQERRPLRMSVREMGWVLDGDALTLEFRLRRGGFATAVLREIIAPQGETVGQGLARSST